MANKGRPRRRAVQSEVQWLRSLAGRQAMALALAADVLRLASADRVADWVEQEMRRCPVDLRPKLDAEEEEPF